MTLSVVMQPRKPVATQTTEAASYPEACDRRPRMEGEDFVADLRAQQSELLAKLLAKRLAELLAEL